MPLVEGLLDRGLIDSSFAADDFFNVDSEVVVSPAMTVAEVVSSLQHSAEADNPSTEDGSEDDCGDEVPLVSHYEASNCLQKLRYFIVQRDGNSDLLDQIGKLEKKIDSFAVKHRYQVTLES